MKIVLVDNFNTETVSDQLVAENVSEFWAPRIASLLNEKFSGDHATRFFSVVQNSYRLFIFYP